MLRQVNLLKLIIIGDTEEIEVNDEIEVQMDTEKDENYGEECVQNLEEAS